MNLRWLKFATLNTLRNRRRSLATVAIAALGTAGILLAGGFAISTYTALAQASARTTGHLIVGKPAQFASDEATPLQHGLDDFEGLSRKLQSDPDVRSVLPKVEFSGLISNGEKSTVMVAVGVSPDDEFSVKGPFLTVKAGEVLVGGIAAQSGEVMLGEALARSMGAKPGSSLTMLATTTDGALNAMDVIVRGVFSTGVPEVDKRLVYTDLKTAQKLLHSDRVSTLGVFLSRMEKTDAVLQRLRLAEPSLAVQTWLEQAIFYQGVKALYNRIFGALGVIIGVIVVVVVGSAMAAAIVERTREVGTLRAMGTLPGQLVRMFAMEGMVLGSVGAIAGALLALCVSVLLYMFPVQMPPPPGRSTGYALNIAIDPLLYGGTVVGIVVVGMLVSAWVARSTVRKPVVAALAHT